jgi:hypothetical protein
MNLTITITDTQNKCLEYVANSVADWGENALTARAEIAQKEILDKLITHCNENNITIATSVDAQITQAYDLGVVKTAVQRASEALDRSAED